DRANGHLRRPAGVRSGRRARDRRGSPARPRRGRKLLSSGGSAMMPIGTRSVLVTGASRGIGRAVVERLLEAEGRVAAVARSLAPLEALARRSREQVAPIACDLADPQARAGLVARARAALGGLDGLVLAAGVVSHQKPGAIDEAALREQ